MLDCAPVKPALSSVCFLEKLRPHTEQEQDANNLMDQIRRGEVSVHAAARAKKLGKQNRLNYYYASQTEYKYNKSKTI